MTVQALFVLVVLIGMITVLAFDKMRPGITLFSVVVLFLSAGIIRPSEAVAGFSNKGMITVAVLFLVSEGVRQSGSLNYLIRKILPTRSTTVRKALVRMLPAIAAISAFLNNTAVVVIFAPLLKKWAERVNLSSRKFLIPLSYATILGGVCTLIGTSTNLVVDGMMQEQGYEGFSMFELGQAGGIIALAGIIYIVLVANRLLPDNRNSVSGKNGEFKEYYYDIYIPSGSILIGTTVRNGQIPGLPRLELRHLKRNGSFSRTGKEEVCLQAGDELILAGKSGGIPLLTHTDGIELCCLRRAEPSFVKKADKQVEAVLGPRFPGINRPLGQFDFYRHYGAVVMAVHRNGERITVDLDHLYLKEGDNLVLLTDGTFISTWGESSVFYLLSEVGDFAGRKPRITRWLALSLLLLMILGATVGEHFSPRDGIRYDMFFFALLTAVVMAWTGIFPAKKYTKYISWDILIAIASAFAISKAMHNSGIADVIASRIISFSHGLGPHGLLATLFVMTNLFTEIITNNAAAALAFPIAVATATQMQVSPMPLFVVICIAASASFATPIGYQTNLIVQSIGGYKFGDFLKIGLPLNLLTFLIAVFVIPCFWNF